MKNADKPIHPSKGNGLTVPSSEGITKREYFAGLAMQSVISSPVSHFIINSENGKTPEQISKWSVQFADELLKQLEKNV